MDRVTDVNTDFGTVKGQPLGKKHGSITYLPYMEMSIHKKCTIISI